MWMYLERTVARSEDTRSYRNSYLSHLSRYVGALLFYPHLDKEEITEEDFEKDEERYHIMKAFEQALCAARAHGGTIDEGNHIYFYQIGINGTSAQVEINAYLSGEGQQVSEEGILPEHENTWEWLHDMADKYSGCAQKFVEQKYMKLLDEKSLHSL